MPAASPVVLQRPGFQRGFNGLSPAVPRHAPVCGGSCWPAQPLAQPLACHVHSCGWVLPPQGAKPAAEVSELVRRMEEAESAAAVAEASTAALQLRAGEAERSLEEARLQRQRQLADITNLRWPAWDHAWRVRG